jgi:hypothetical protein
MGASRISHPLPPARGWVSPAKVLPPIVFRHNFLSFTSPRTIFVTLRDRARQGGKVPNRPSDVGGFPTASDQVGVADRFRGCRVTPADPLRTARLRFRMSRLSNRPAGQRDLSCDGSTRYAASHIQPCARPRSAIERSSTIDGKAAAKQPQADIRARFASHGRIPEASAGAAADTRRARSSTPFVESPVTLCQP